MLRGLESLVRTAVLVYYRRGLSPLGWQARAKHPFCYDATNLLLGIIAQDGRMVLRFGPCPDWV